jgi:hypothetical protein
MMARWGRGAVSRKDVSREGEGGRCAVEVGQLESGVAGATTVVESGAGEVRDSRGHGVDAEVGNGSASGVSSRKIYAGYPTLVRHWGEEVPCEKAA